MSNTTDKMLIKIDKDLAEFITTMAENNGISKVGYVNSLLEKAIKQEIDDDCLAAEMDSSDIEMLQEQLRKFSPPQEYDDE